MLKKFSFFLPLAAAALVLIAWHPRALAATSDSTAPSELGAPLGPAPVWHLKDLDGHPVSSDQFKGKVVVFDFWATWCPPCRAELPGYVALQKKYGANGLVIIGAAVQEPDAATVKKFVESNGISYRIVMADDTVQTAFGGIDAVPTTFLIDRDGMIRDKKVGAMETADYEKRILSVLNEVN